jgi:hypothetical protein
VYTQLKDDAEPLGDMLIAIFNLCRILKPNPYDDEFEWFRRICWEIYHRQAVLEAIGEDGFDQKKKLYDGNRAFIKQLFHPDQPTNPVNRLTLPISWNFCELGIAQFPKRDRSADKRFWCHKGHNGLPHKSFHKALSDFNERYNKAGHSRLRVRDGILYKSVGKGKSHQWKKIC